MPATLLQQLNSTVTANVKDYGAQGDGVTDDTTAVNAAFTVIKTLGYGTIYFPVGNYLIPDGLVLQSASNFTLRGDRGSTLWIGPNTSSFPARATHNVCTIADCTDFTVEGMTFDARKDTIAADQYVASGTAASGQKNITVADGTKYFVGTVVSVYGGLTANGGTEKTFNEFNSSITAISGNVLTLNNNLTHTYTGTGASGGAYVTQYQTGISTTYTVAGRGLGNEDAQNGLHLITCNRFVIRNCTAQNTWESQIKMGTGFATTVVTDGCSNGIVTGNMCKHGYDQGISVWNSQYITVANNWCQDSGWAGVSFSHCNDCTGSGNVCISNNYSPATDLNEGSGMAVEGGVRIVLQGNVCSGNTSNGIRLNLSPLFGGIALSATTTGALTAGATSLTLTATNANFVAGSSFTLIDPNNNMIRENIYVASVSGAVITLSTGLRNSYATAANILARFGEDVVLTGNICSLQALSAGIHCDQQINLRVFSNDCSKNGWNGSAFVDVQGCYGIHLHGFCQQAVVEANTCSYNAQEGIVIDNDNRACVIQANSACNNGIKGTNTKMGIKMYGPVDTSIIGNICNFNTHTGIYLQTGNVAPAHVSIIGNTSMYNSTSGIWLDNNGTTIKVNDNKIAYNSDTGIKVTGYQNCIFQGNHCYNQAGQEGIRFDDNGSNYCLDNRVFDNFLYDDQGSHTQSWGFRELNNSARTVLRGNRTYGNTNAAQISIATTSRIAPDVALDSNTHDSTVVGVFNAIMPSADMQNATFNVWVDESGNNLKFQVKYSSGTVKNGSVALT